MTATTVSAVNILRPEDVQELLVKPVLAKAVAANPLVSNVVSTGSKEFRVPVVTGDPSAAWVAEGAEIPLSDMTFGEAGTVPAKVAGLSLVTREAVADTNPSVQAVIGDGLARDIARRVDEAFFANGTANAGEQPDGLAALPVGVNGTAQVQDLPIGTAPTDLDGFLQAVAMSATYGGSVSSFLVHPTTLLTLQRVKKTGTNENLLQPDPQNAARSQAAGVPFVPSQHAPVGTVWAVSAQHMLTVVREDAEVESSQHAFFTSDRVALKGVMRVSFLPLHPPTLVRIRLAAT